MLKQMSKCNYLMYMYNYIQMDPTPAPVCPVPDWKTKAFRHVHGNISKKSLYAKATRTIVCK